MTKNERKCENLNLLQLHQSCSCHYMKQLLSVSRSSRTSTTAAKRPLIHRTTRYPSRLLHPLAAQLISSVPRRFLHSTSTLQTRSTLSPPAFSNDPRTTQYIQQLCNPLTDLDPESAALELTWLRQASTTDLLSLIDRRAKGEPIQYILGTVDFGPLDLLCRPPVLIPRSETAHVFSRLASELGTGAGLRILDLCTGSGCVALLLSTLLAGRLDHIWAVDISVPALELAKDNATRTGVGNVSFLHGDIADPTFRNEMRIKTGGVDLIVSNPPYLTTEEWEAAPHSVQAFEDPRALVGQGSPNDRYGVSFYSVLADWVNDLSRFDRNDSLPSFAFEIGSGQADAARRVIAEGLGGGAGRMEVWLDQFELDRAVVGWGTPVDRLR